MICILKTNGAEISGWLIAADVADARRQAYGAGDQQLAEYLYRMEWTPMPGKYLLPSGHVMLVS